MSRSRRKVPICGITKAESEAEDKARSARKLRRKVRQAELDGDEMLPENPRDVFNTYSITKNNKMRRRCREISETILIKSIIHSLFSYAVCVISPPCISTAA